MNVSCPSCSRALLLPPDFAGKMVKCPICQAVFPAGESGASAPGEGMTIKKPLPPLADPEPMSTRYDDRFDVPSLRRWTSIEREDAEARPRPRGQRGYNYEDDFDFSGRRYHRQDMKEAESAVAAPAICLIGYGGVWMIFGLCFAFGSLEPANGPNGRLLFLALSTVILVYAGFIILGAIMMKTMRSWGFALAGGILSLITHPCNIVGIGLGVWAIDVLNKKYVKRAFRRKMEGDDDDDD